MTEDTPKRQDPDEVPPEATTASEDADATDSPDPVEAPAGKPAKPGKPGKPSKAEQVKPIPPGKVDLKVHFVSEIAIIEKMIPVIGDKGKTLKTDVRGIIAMLRAAKDKMQKVK